MTLIPIATQAQAVYDSIWGAPLEQKICFSGLFGEPRTGHIHTGIDLRVGGRLGDPIYAMSDGYVSRIWIKKDYGGKMLFVTHPNGYTTVYMHLSRYADNLDAFVKHYHKAHQMYEMDVTFPRDSIRVKRGDIIGYVGSTGASMGPHLHVELRDKRGEMIYNPLSIGMPFSDDIAPVIKGIRLYPADEDARINGKRTAQTIAAGSATAEGRFYVGVWAVDRAEGSTMNNGIYRMEVYWDTVLRYRYQMDSLPLAAMDSVASLIDYPYYTTTRNPYILTHTSGIWIGSPLHVNDGLFEADPDAAHHLRIVVSDIKGNTAERTLIIKPRKNPRKN